MPVKINGATSGSVTLAAPNTGGDVTLTLPVLGFGKVLQVVQASTTTSTTVASTSYTDTTLSATITPSSTASQILVIAFQSVYNSRSTFAAGNHVRLLRGGTTLLTTTNAPYVQAPGASAIILAGTSPIFYLDSPATTSATTYKTQIAAESAANSGQVVAQSGSTPSVMILVEVGP